MTGPDNRVVVIDNYDSFTYNLVQHLGRLGCRISVFRNDKISVDEVAALKPKAVVISPGPCTPNEAGISLELVDTFKNKLPILGVCLGHQVIGQAFGASVVRGSYPVHGKTSEIHHDGRTVYEGIPNPFVATRYHSLVVAEETVPVELEVTARTAEGVVMGLRAKRGLVEGLQFHPESVLTDPGLQIIQNFLHLAHDIVKHGPA